MRILTDEAVDARLSDKLMGKGFSVKTVQAIAKKGLDDTEVLKLANEKERVLITYDYDFKAINRHPSEAKNGIIVVKLKEKAVFEILPKFCHIFTERSDISSMKNKIVEVGKRGYQTIFIDERGEVQKCYAEYDKN